MANCLGEAMEENCPQTVPSMLRCDATILGDESDRGLR